MELLKESLSELKELRKRVDRNTLLLEDLRHQGTDASLLRLQEDAFHTHLEVALPVSTVEDLQALEMKLEDKELAKKMVRGKIILVVPVRWPAFAHSAVHCNVILAQFHGSAYCKLRICAYGSREFCAYGMRISWHSTLTRLVQKFGA